MTTLKEWMDQQWRNPGVQYAGHGVAFLGTDLKSLQTRAGTERKYKSKEQKAYEARFGIYNKKLVPIILAEATLTDGVYRWPAHTKPEPAAPVESKASTSIPRKRVPKAKLEQAAAIIARVPQDELTAFLARFGLSLSLAASIASLGDAETIARQFLRVTL